MKKENNPVPLLSVCLITYNHAAYIEQALKSVLMQQCDFSWELVIADDYSTDGTRDILLNYQKKYPELIKLILQEKNVGAFKNWMDLIDYPQSKYLAYLDGDDYWTDSLKLQKQVNFLEKNPDYSICAHLASTLEGKAFHVPDSADSKSTFNIQDLAKANFLVSSTVVYRNGLVKQLPDWFELSPAGDYVMHMLYARTGKIKILPDNMAVYRKHPAGAWSNQSFINLLEKWMVVLTLLLTEDFDKQVINELKIQKRDTATDYLQRLMEFDQAVFATKLKELTDEDPELAKQWLLDYFPSYIAKLKQSTSYKLSRKIANMASGLKRVFGSNYH